MKSNLLTGMAAALLLGLGISSVNATPVFYTDEATFLTAAATAGISLSVESFEASVTDLGQTVTFPGGSMVCTAGNSCGTSTFSATDGATSLSWTPDSTADSATFNLTMPTNAFGIDVIDGLEFAPFDLMLSASGDSILLDFASNQGHLNVQFIGVIDTMQTFSVATISGAGDGDQHFFDRLQTGTASIPEPGTLALFGLGLVGLGFARRRKAAA